MVPKSEQSEVTVAGLSVRPYWTMLLFVLLVASALLAFVSRDSDVVPDGVRRAAPLIFLAFAFGFSGYRMALVAARRYSPFKAFFQILSAALFFLLLQNPQAGNAIALSIPRPSEIPAQVPTHAAIEQTAAESQLLPWALAHQDAKVRTLASEVAFGRGDRRALLKLLSDSDLGVRTKAHALLVNLNQGRDLGTETSDWEASLK
jgi:hypothetical protein